MAKKPRQEIEEMIRGKDLRGLLDKGVELHGHYCHKLAYGIKASVLAVRELGIETTGSPGMMDEAVAVVECTGGFCNGVQLVTGYSLGTSALVIKDYGKPAVSLIKRDGSAIRVALRPEFADGFAKRHPQMSAIFGKFGAIAVPEGEKIPLPKTRLGEILVNKLRLTEEDMAEMMEGMEGMVAEELEIPDEEMFKIERKKLDFSAYTPICQCTYPVVQCARCGELVFEPYARVKDGEVVCIPCAGDEYYVLTGKKIQRVTANA